MNVREKLVDYMKAGIKEAGSSVIASHRNERTQATYIVEER